DDGEGDEGEEDANGDTEALKKKLGDIKRKRPAAPPASKPRKKPSKGPKTNIEYEYVPEPQQPQMMLAR
ncbi:hypothetical protein KC336_g20737, partial [Hortaea werneckii]